MDKKKLNTEEMEKVSGGKEELTKQWIERTTECHQGGFYVGEEVYYKPCGCASKKRRKVRITSFYVKHTKFFHDFKSYGVYYTELTGGGEESGHYDDFEHIN